VVNASGSFFPCDYFNSCANANAVEGLEGLWRFELDPADAGIKQEWFKRTLPGRIRLPGILQSQESGSLVSTSTPWVLSLYDRFWYLREDYKAYTETGKVKVPFLSQPQRHYIGPRGFSADVQIPPNFLGRRSC
jgi:hypothetical protein